jgi:hypothetical protein
LLIVLLILVRMHGMCTPIERLATCSDDNPETAPTRIDHANVGYEQCIFPTCSTSTTTKRVAVLARVSNASWAVTNSTSSFPNLQSFLQSPKCWPPSLCPSWAAGLRAVPSDLRWRRAAHRRQTRVFQSADSSTPVTMDALTFDIERTSFRITR